MTRRRPAMRAAHPADHTRWRHADPGPLPRCLNRIPRTGLPARPHIRSRLCPQALRVGVPRHPAETSAATRRDTPSDTSASEIRPRARPIRGTRPPYRSLVHLPRRMSFRLPVPPLNRLFAYVLVDKGQRPRAGVHLAIRALRISPPSGRAAGTRSRALSRRGLAHGPCRTGCPRRTRGWLRARSCLHCKNRAGSCHSSANWAS